MSFVNLLVWPSSKCEVKRKLERNGLPDLETEHIVDSMRIFNAGRRPRIRRVRPHRMFNWGQAHMLRWPLSKFWQGSTDIMYIVQVFARLLELSELELFLYLFNFLKHHIKQFAIKRMILFIIFKNILTIQLSIQLYPVPPSISLFVRFLGEVTSP